MLSARVDVRATLRWSTPPFLAWLAASAITWCVARASDVAYWSVAGRERWDSAHYLSISRDGYEMFRCWDRAGYAEAGFRDVLCGNVAWFPGYPVVVRAFAAAGLSPDVAAVVVSELALLGMFAALWYLLGSRLTSVTGLIMALGVVFPGGIYFHMAFPIALGTLALLVAVIGVKRGSWVIAAAGGFVAAACHLVGAVAVGMLLLSVFFAWRSDPVRVRVAKALGSAVVAAGGVLWAKWMMWRATGAWDAYEQINESSYGQGGLKNPLTEARTAYDLPFKDYFLNPDTTLTWLTRGSLEAHHLQLWLNGLLVLVLLFATGWRLLRDRRLEVDEWAALLLMGAIFLMPFFAGAKMSWYRNHGQMFVALLLFRNIRPRWLQITVLVVLLVLCTVQYVRLAAMVFAGVLV
ncbi:MAG: hypothetical protein NTV23_14760 [Propionibacteriales bacterium]|nr:hypothetical protein [Propionibacteriales bacterium]